MKLVFDGEGLALLIREDTNLFWRIFLVGEISRCLTVGWDSHPIVRVSHKDTGERGTVHTWWGKHSNTMGGGTFGQKGDTGV